MKLDKRLPSEGNKTERGKKSNLPQKFTAGHVEKDQYFVLKMLYIVLVELNSVVSIGFGKQNVFLKHIFTSFLFMVQIFFIFNSIIKLIKSAANKGISQNIGQTSILIVTLTAAI